MNQTKLPALKIEIPHTLIGAKLEQLIGIGFRVIPNMRAVLGEGTYCVAEAPDGWSVRPGPSHSHTQYLHDQHGRRRAEMLHQMNFSSRTSDRRVMTMLRRFDIDMRAYGGSPKKRAVVITDVGVEAHRLGTYRVDMNDMREMSRLEVEARAWLAKNYPQHTDAMAHWDDPVAPAVQVAAADHAAA